MNPVTDQWLRGLVRDEVSNILNPKVIIKRARDNNLPEPSYMHEGDAGLALYADMDGDSHVLENGRSIAIKCGWHFHWPPGFVGLVMGRSGLSFKQGIRVFYVGTIDQGYTGEISIKLENISGQLRLVKHGDHIAQLLILPVAHALVRQGEMPKTTRGENGFGSTDRLTKAATGLGAVEASRLIHEHAQRDQALHRDDKVRFHVMPESPPESGYLSSSTIGGLYMLNSTKDLPPSTLTGDVWKLIEIHDERAPAMVTLENTTTKARITVKQDDWWRAYHYLGHIRQISTAYLHRSGHRYVVRERDESTARAFLVPENPADPQLDASVWVRIDKLVPPLWRQDVIS